MGARINVVGPAFVADTIHTQVGTVMGYASSAFGTALGMLEGLSAAGRFTVPDISGEVVYEGAAPSYTAPSMPSVPGGLSINLGGPPTEPAIPGVSGLAISNAPEFTAALAALNMPNPPAALTTSVPIKPLLSGAVAPTAPSIVLPDVPSLMGISIPAAPTISIPDFSATLGMAPAAPANAFAFVEPSYTSGLLVSLRARLQEWVDGESTGLAPAVEQAIWNRGRAREAVTSGRKVQEVLRDFASRGFSKPPGALAVAMQAALQASQDVDVTASREVMIKQADLEQSNRKFAFDTAFKIESELITYQNLIAQRAFEVARYVQQVAIDLFVAEVKSYDSQVQAYATRAQVFKTMIDAELSKLEVYKATLEGQKIISEINGQAVEIYRAKISAVMSLIDIFKAQLEAANLTLQGDKLRIEGFAAEVGAYDSTVRAKATEYQGYATMTQAELAKVEVFKGQADAYRSQVEGFRAVVTAAVDMKRLEIEANVKTPVDLFKVRTEAYRNTVEAESVRVGALTKVFDAQASMFGAQVQGAAASVNAGATVYKAGADVAVASAQVKVEAAKANVTAIIQQAGVLMEAMKGGSQVAAGVASGALSAINLSMQLGEHANISDQTSSGEMFYGKIG